MRRGLAAVALPGVVALALFAAWCAVAVAGEPESDAGARRLIGNATPQATLDLVRLDPSRSSDPGAIQLLATQLDAFPPGPVQVEGRMFVAEAWLGRLHRPADALPLLRAVRDDPGAPAITARLAAREIVDALVATGHLDEASAEAATHADLLDPGFLKQTRAIVRRRTIRWTALAELGGFAALAGVALLRGFRRGALGQAGTALRRIAPVAALFVVYLAGLGGLLASQYETGNAAPFVGLGLVVLPLLLLARAWSAVGSSGAGARAGRAVVCAVTVLAATFVLLDTVHPSYLEGFGL
jgi:hypothetical protein